MSLPERKLTQYESVALAHEYNLADAHTHQFQSPSQATIVANLPQLFHEAQSKRQPDLDREAFDAYHRLCGQSSIVGSRRGLNCYSASIAMEIVASLLASHSQSLTLIEPTFDNIADILKRHLVSLTPLAEEKLLETDLGEVVRSITTECLFLTLPNNPTGTFLDADRFAALAHACAVYGKILILDMCFRLYEPGFCFDQYEILHRSGVRYIAMEDTGKCWPMLDLKVSFINSSSEFSAELLDIRNDMLLNVSPFILQLVTEFCRDSQTDRFSSIRGLVQENRDFLRSQLRPSMLQPARVNSHISVELLEILNGTSSLILRDLLAQHEIHVLPGAQFYWYDALKGDPFIRIALARDPKQFQEAVIAMMGVLDEIFSPNDAN